MFDRKLILATCVATAALTATAFAQQPAPVAKDAPAPQVAMTTAADTVPEGGTPAWIKPETPAHRRDRLGTSEDPGPNPDSKKQWWRYGRAFTIERYERKWAAYDREEGSVRPYAMVNFAWEIYQQNERYVWVWMPVDQPPHDEEVTPAQPGYTPYAIKFFEKTRSQFVEKSPEPNGSTIRFTESSDGLPTQGSWRNSLDVADMNGDGFVDLIVPPQRGASGNGVPSIFLGDGKGHWKLWQEASWPHALDYGSVVAADFNKDGKMDLAFAVHLNGIYIFLGDGKGNFTEVTQGVPRDFGSRRIIVVDANGDGYPDLAAVSEGPSVRASGGQVHGSAILLLNKDKGKAWETVDIAKPGTRAGGDWMSAGNFNAGRTPDFLLASIFFGSWDVLFLSKSAKQWDVYPSDGDAIPSRAYFYASAAGRISSKTRDDAIISFLRNWPQDLENRVVATPAIRELVEIDRLTFASGKPERIPIARWSGHEAVSGLALADFNGDGKNDIIYTRTNPREVVVLLGDGKGGFTRSAVEGLTLQDLGSYDIKVADVNGDGRPDVILMYESGAKTAFATQDGSVRVYLNRGVTKTTQGAETKK